MASVTAREERTIKMTGPIVKNKGVKPVTVWAVLGVVCLSIEVVALSGWIISGNAQAQTTGPTPVPGWMRAVAVILQIGFVIAFAVFIYLFLIRPWRRQGRITLDGLFCLVFMTIFWQDSLENGFQHWLTYNSVYVNLGSWDPWILGWLSPNAQFSPQPLLLYPAYVWGIFGGVIVGNVFMARLQARKPHMSNSRLFLASFGFYLVFALVEPPLLFLGMWAYPGGISWMTLFHGHYYQFPLHEWFFFATLMTSWSALRFFRNDRGETLAERGVDGLETTPARKTVIRFLALAGACNVIFLVSFNIPHMIVGLYASPWPEDIVKRSYLNDRYCGPGTTSSCPGPGIPIPRPDSARVGPDGQLVIPNR